MLRVQGAGTHRTAQSGVLVLDAGLTQQACVMPLLAVSCSTLDTYSAVLKRRKENGLFHWQEPENRPFISGSFDFTNLPDTQLLI